MKKILIEFADPSIRAIDHIRELTEAVNYAGVNLLARHKIDISLSTTEEGRVFVIMTGDKVDSVINIGSRLRGISGYLLKNYKDGYHKHMVGNRLLNYVDCRVEENEMTNRGRELYDRFCEMFPQLCNENQTFKEIPGGRGIIVNPVSGARGPKYTFIFRNEYDWTLNFN